MKRRVPALGALLAILFAVPIAALFAAHALAAEPPGAEAEREWKRVIRERLSRKVSFEFTGTPLTEAVTFLQTLTKLNMILDPDALREAGDAAVTMGATNGPLAAALGRVLAAAKMEHALIDHAVFISTRWRIDALKRYEEARRRWRAPPVEPPEWERAIRRMLDRTVSFEFGETPFTEGVQFLQTLTKTTFILDPRADAGAKAITLKVTEMPFGTAFKWICRLAGCDYALLDEAVFISSPKLLAEEALRSAERSAAEREDAGEEPEWKRAMRQRLSRKVSFEFAETPLTEAITFLQTLTKVSMIVDPQAIQAKGNTPITLKVTNMTLDRALRWVLRPAELDYVLKDGAIRFTRPEEPEWKRRIRRLMERKVSFEFADLLYVDALPFLLARLECDFAVDPAVARDHRGGFVSLKADDTTCRGALEWLLKLSKLDYVVFDGAVFIAEPDRIVEVLWRKVADVGATGEFAERRKLIRSHLKAKASFEFTETPVSEAIQFVLSLSRMNMILAPEAVQERGNVPITLKVTNMRLALVLDWLVRLAGLDYDLRDGAIFISTPKFIRGQAAEGGLEERTRKGRGGEAEGEGEDVF